MEFKFDSQQQYQLDAISAVVELFEGQPADAGAMEAKLQIDFFSKTEETLIKNLDKYIKKEIALY